MRIPALYCHCLWTLSLLAVAGCNELSGSSTASSKLATALADESDDGIRDRIDRALDFTVSKRHMDQQKNAAWQVVHGILVYGRGLQMDVQGRRVSALDYLLRGGTLNGWNLRKGDHGVKAILEPGSKTGMGHPDQWLGYMAQCGVPLDERLVVGGADYTIGDLLTQAQWDIYPGMEATWTLMATSVYLPSDAHWTASDGSEWDIARIVGMEADADVDSSACGGSHRLYGLAVALNRHLAEGGKLEGPWLRADERIKDAIAKTKANQQSDGTFSTNFFARPSTSADLALRLNTTGHTFEFLTVALDEQQFKEPWFARSLAALLGMLERTQDIDLECGGLYHAVHGLQLYRARRFGPAEQPDVAASTGAPAEGERTADRAPTLDE